MKRQFNNAYYRGWGDARMYRYLFSWFRGDEVFNK